MSYQNTGYNQCYNPCHNQCYDPCHHRPEPFDCAEEVDDAVEAHRLADRSWYTLNEDLEVVDGEAIADAQNLQHSDFALTQLEHNIPDTDIAYSSANVLQYENSQALGFSSEKKVVHIIPDMYIHTPFLVTSERLGAIPNQIQIIAKKKLSYGLNVAVSNNITSGVGLNLTEAGAKRHGNLRLIQSPAASEQRARKQNVFTLSASEFAVGASAAESLNNLKRGESIKSFLSVAKKEHKPIDSRNSSVTERYIPRIVKAEIMRSNAVDSVDSFDLKIIREIPIKRTNESAPKLSPQAPLILERRDLQGAAIMITRKKLI